MKPPPARFFPPILSLVLWLLLAGAWVLSLAQAAGAAGATGHATRIALVSDTHTTRDTAGDQSLYRGRLDRVIAEVNAAKVDVVLIAGDLTQDGTDEQFDDFKAQIASLDAPVLCVPGNHDIGAKVIPGKADGPDLARIARYEGQLGPTFFARTISGVRFIGINAPVLGSDLPLEREMWTLLERELVRPGPVPAIVFLHYPPFVKAVDEADGGYWNLEPAPRSRLLALLRQGGARIVLAGHTHVPRATRHDGMLLVVTPPVSFGLPRGKQPQGWTLVTLRADGEADHEFRTAPE